MGIKAFRIEILALCKTEKELLATEAFWTLYSNRISFGVGYDLAENIEFNPVVLGWDTFSPYDIPKWELIRLILQGKKSGGIAQYYTNKYAKSSQIDWGTISRRLLKNFDTLDIHKIRLRILKPLLEECFRRGFNCLDALTYLKGSGVEWYSGRTHVRSQLSDLTNDAVEIFGDMREGIQADRWNAIREKFFTEPYIEFLRSQGISDFPSGDASQFSIIEYLLAKDIPITEIGIQIGLCEADATKVERRNSASFIYNYLRSKYKDAFENYSTKNVINYLKSQFIGDDLYW